MKKIVFILFQIVFLYLFSFLGTLIVEMLSIPFPGSMLGLILLFICLQLKIIPVSYIKDGAGFLLAFLALFFVPATAGIMEYPHFLSWTGGLMLFSLIASTIFTIFITGRVCEFFLKKWTKEEMAS